MYKMSSRYHLRPENAMAKADEFIKVDKPTRALDTLYEVIKSKKRNHSFSEKELEKLMYKYLELCIELRKSYIAKEGLYQYRNMCQSTNVALLASVIQYYLSSTEKRTEAARQESKDLVADLEGELDNLNTPETILLRAVSGEDAQDRSDRKVLAPWVRFLWESYLQCLDLLRTNSRVERLYHDIAQQAFRFCLKYQRRTEFRMLCEKIRTHLDMAFKQTLSPMSIDLNSLETQQLSLDTRLVQLDSAIQLELWQEAYKAVEDIYGLMIISKKSFQPKTMSNYYQKVALVFWKSGYHLFHAAAIFKHFQLNREMKKNVSTEELGKMASRVLLAVLAVPVSSHQPEFEKFIEMEYSPQEKMVQLATLLGLQQPPTRASLIKDIYRFGIVQAALPETQNLYHHLEVDFNPLKLCFRVQSFVEYVEQSEELSFLEQYIPPLKDITLVRLLKQISQTYNSICFNRLLEFAPFTDAFGLERIIVECSRFHDLQVRIDHRSRTLHFGNDLTESCDEDNLMGGPHLQDMPSEQIRTQLMVMMKVLVKSVQTIHPQKVKLENNVLRNKIIESYHQSKQRDHERVLQRQKAIEDRKELLEKKAYDLAVEEEYKKEEQLREQQILEEKRLQAEREEREERKKEEEIRQIQQRHIKEKVNQIAQTDIGKKVLEKMDEKEIAELDADQIMARQVVELEREKKDLIMRLKSQDKKIDHFERAKRQEEIPLLEQQFQKDLENDKIFWVKKEDDRIAQTKEERKIALATQSRLFRIKEDKDKYLENILKERKSVFETKLAEFNKLVKTERAKRLAERKEMRKIERREKWIKDMKEVKQKIRDEKIKMEREEEQRLERERIIQEEEAWLKKNTELDVIEAKQRQREKEIEEKMQFEEIKYRDTKEEPSSWRRAPQESRRENIVSSKDTSRNSETSGSWRDDRGTRRVDGRETKQDDLRRDNRRDGDNDLRKGDRRDDFRRGDRGDDFRRGDRRDDFKRDEFRRGDRRDDFRRDDRRDDIRRGDRDMRRDDRFNSKDGRNDNMNWRSRYDCGIAGMSDSKDTKQRNNDTGNWRRDNNDKRSTNNKKLNENPDNDNAEDGWTTVRH
ncbi:eukaryotic translation initiation factor 3 subunit A [Lepeophtheirus salmonis]|uniref:eukaryotic translation initiation factor 3 subunit A n=1 Tax=Lepeophtheirus salmonis TaxID=72036 RepID=UPI001AE9F2A5|nr:eukaryotic translation initiation factor 3 subunit A-like [Lepeophtheirus salmonis]